MSTGEPERCMAALYSGLTQLVFSKSLGHCCTPSHSKEIAEYILDLANDQEECKRLSNNSLIASK